MSLFKTNRGAGPYQGITMMTADGVHAAAQRLIERRVKQSSRSKVRALDLASGQGALVQRLVDMGMGRVDAWEVETAQFKIKGVKVRPVDLNQDFPAVKQPYDLITACEIIEHLENPYHFCRQIAKILHPRGVLILSTPNIESAVSRVHYLRTGNPRWFDDYAFDQWGHIMPVSRWMLEKCLNQAGLKIQEVSSNSEQALVTVDPGWRGKIQGWLALLLYPLMAGNRKGDVNVWLITHA